MTKHVVQLRMSTQATDLCSSNYEASLFVITLCNSDCRTSLFLRTLCYVCENYIFFFIIVAPTNVHLLALLLLSLIFIYLYIFVAFINIHLFTLRTNKPLFSLCLQVIENAKNEEFEA